MSDGGVVTYRLTVRSAPSRSVRAKSQASVFRATIGSRWRLRNFTADETTLERSFSDLLSSARAAPAPDRMRPRGLSGRRVAPAEAAGRIVDRREHRTERVLDGPTRIGQERQASPERLVALRVQDVEDDPHEEVVGGEVPVEVPV